MTSLLRGVVERGTAAERALLKRPIAGKTGTTNDFTDAWFIGYEPRLAAGVWVRLRRQAQDARSRTRRRARGAAHVDGLLGARS